MPFAVVNDLNFLALLPERACRDGIIEAIKVSLIRDKNFYEFIEGHAEELQRFGKSSSGENNSPQCGESCRSHCDEWRSF